LTILELLEDPDCAISDLESLISQDVTLSYKILRIINSAFYGFRRKIDSVKQAIVSLGLKVIRDWFIVISLTDIDDKPHSLIFQTLQRARMMQLLADVLGLNMDTGFTVGLFSSIDATYESDLTVFAAIS
jgi:c-di-GMP phosphodiesterase